MRILVNASNLKSAGGLTVALNFLSTAARKYPQAHFLLLSPPNVPQYQALSFPNIEMVPLPTYISNMALRVFAERPWAKKILRKYHPDVIFSMGNFAMPIVHAQAVLFHYPYAAYPKDKAIWDVFSPIKKLDIQMRVRLMASRFKYASVVFPQTETIAAQLHKHYPQIKQLKVVPNAYSKVALQGSIENALPFFRRSQGYFYFLSLSRYYLHKNLEIFLPVAQRIRALSLPYRLLVTIDPNQDAEAERFLKKIETAGLGDVIINLGNIPIDCIGALYKQVDALLMPTLLESFSTTYADAMAFSKPIFTSNRDFAIEVCKDAAWYFDPTNPDDLLKTIEEALAQPKQMAQKTMLGQAYSKEMLDWQKVADLYMAHLWQLTDLKTTSISQNN
jgi:glycosyltransferase involved in cell wall biosynthesis